MSEQVMIAGTGPAGLTAALYLARGNRNPLVINGNLPGGQLTTTTLVENYPGFAEGVMGPDLMDTMRRQAERFGARFRPGLVTGVDFTSRPFTVTVGGDTLECLAFIVATGASPRYLGLESEKALIGKGVSTCATCDGAFYRGKRVIVVGGGDSAVEEATFLTKFAERVVLVHRRDTLRASDIMQKRVFENKKIEIIWDTVPVEIHDAAKGEVTGVTLRNTKTGDTREMEIDGVFLAIGHTPNTAFLKGALDVDQEGYIACGKDGCQTAVEGVFACGDVMDARYRQVATSVGTGCRAAIDCDRFLAEH